MRKLIPTLLITALLTVAALLSACGQKGPLYLPQDQAASADDEHNQQQQSDQP